MQKFFIQKAFLLFTLLFVTIAAFSFVAFRETEEVCTGAANACKLVKPAKNNEMLWDMVSRRLLSLVVL